MGGLKSYFRKRSLRVPDDKRTKAAELTLRESLYPIGLVTVLFFLWGFSYGLLDTLNKHFQNTLGISKTRSAGLQAAYFGAYPLASLGHAAWILRHYGYRAVFIWGLFLYGLGALLTIPTIIYHNFGGFCFCIFIIGNGLGSLETAANPYVAVCGPPKYSEIRINLSQAFNGIGTVVAPVLGSYVFFKFDEETALRNVQWVYLAIACFVFILGIAFYISDIPEITDADMEHQAAETHAGEADIPLRRQYRLFHASFAQFCYCGAQVAIASFFINYVMDTRPGTDSSLAAKFLAGAQASFAIGRFVGVGLMHLIKPRIVFGIFMTMIIVFVSPAITQHGNTGLSLLYVTLFFESIIFPTIVALGLRGLGRHTKRGSGFIVGAVLGGAVVPPAMGYAGDRHGTPFSLIVVVMFFLASWTYALAVNFVPYYRDNADAFTATRVGLEGRQEGVVEYGDKGLTAVGDDEKVSVPTSADHVEKS